MSETENVGVGMKKVTQIIAYRKNSAQSYFCSTPEQERVFAENNLNVKTETFRIELLTSTANRYLNNQENKKQFTKQEKIR